MSWFKTGVSVIDYWTVAHFAFWWFVGSSAAPAGWNRWAVLGVSVVLMVGWEVFERFAERNWPEIWQHPESTPNIVSDVVVGIAGLLLAWWGFDHWRT